MSFSNSRSSEDFSAGDPIPLVGELPGGDDGSETCWMDGDGMGVDKLGWRNDAIELALSRPGVSPATNMSG